MREVEILPIRDSEAGYGPDEIVSSLRVESLFVKADRDCQVWCKKFT